MANLTNAQKNTIKNRANGTNGETKTSGSALAAEYGVSASAISNIKNHYTPTVTATIEAMPETPKAKTKRKAKAKTKRAKTETVVKRTVIVHSPKFPGKSFDVVATTFGALLKEIGEDESVEGIFKKAKNRKKLTSMKDELPDTGDQALHLFLIPLKTDAGNPMRA